MIEEGGTLLRHHVDEPRKAEDLLGLGRTRPPGDDQLARPGLLYVS
jgi:hypothetical protein